jgi:hypothetical protein
MVLFDEIVILYWSVDADNVTKGKIKEEQCCKDRLREVFATNVSLADPLVLMRR